VGFSFFRTIKYYLPTTGKVLIFIVSTTKVESQDVESHTDESQDVESQFVGLVDVPFPQDANATIANNATSFLIFFCFFEFYKYSLMSLFCQFLIEIKIPKNLPLPMI
jgi:hypothetical protein